VSRIRLAIIRGPHQPWDGIDRQVLAPVMVDGVVQRPECRFSADLAVIRCVLSDGVATIGPYRMHALLAHDDRVPALLGLAGALEEAALSVILRHDSAYLETT